MIWENSFSLINRSFRAAKLFVLLLSIPPASFSQTTQADLEIVVANAQSLPAEYRADILLTVLESGKINDKQWRKEITEEVFIAAEQVRNPYKLNDADLYGDADSAVSKEFDRAFRLNLDRLSIQSRVIRIVLKDSPVDARQYMARMAKPEISGIPCSSPLVADPTMYYETVLDVFRRGFTKQEKSNGGDIVFLRNALQGNASIDDLIPISVTIRKLSDFPDFQSELLQVFTQHLIRLSSIKNSDRQFSYREKDLGISKEIKQLIEMSGSQKRSAIDALLFAYQKFLISHLSGNRCGDTAETGFKLIRTGNPENPKERQSSVTFFNSMLRFSDNPIESLNEEKLRSLISHDVNADIESLSFSPLKGLLGNLLNKKYGKEDTSEFDQRPWENQVLKVLNDLDAVKNSDPCPRCSFHERTFISLMLVDALGNKTYLQSRALNSCIIFLAGSKMQQDSPIEWLTTTKFLLRLTRPLSQEEQKRVQRLESEGKQLSMLPVPNGQNFLELMMNSGSPVLAAYAHLEMKFPQPFNLPY